MLVLLEMTDSSQQAIWTDRLVPFRRAIPGVTTHFATIGELNTYYHCTLLSTLSDPELEDAEPTLPPSSMMVLLDRENRIRGYYNSARKEEFDRLTMEIGVLLTVYKQEEDGK